MQWAHRIEAEVIQQNVRVRRTQAVGHRHKGVHLTP